MTFASFLLMEGRRKSQIFNGTHRQSSSSYHVARFSEEHETGCPSED